MFSPKLTACTKASRILGRMIFNIVIAGISGDFKILLLAAGHCHAAEGVFGPALRPPWGRWRAESRPLQRRTRR